MANFEEKYVDAIEEGKIVRVSEAYAKSEGLLILRRDVAETKKEAPVQQSFRTRREKQNKKDEEGRMLFDDFRRPLNWRKNQVLSELADNFHWEILKARKARNMTRKQLSEKVGCSENDIKLLENGLVPSNDFVLINKVQNYFGINLRKDKKDFSSDARKMVEYKEKEEKRPETRMERRMEERKEKKEEKAEEQESIIGDDIELADNLDEDDS